MKKFKYLIFILLFLVIGCNKKDDYNLSMYFFKVGKADSTLIRTKNHNILIDTGTSDSSRTILSYLKDNNIDTIDYLIITHFDKDHVGGAASIIDGVKVLNVYQSNYVKDSSEYKSYVKALSSKSISSVTLRESYSFEIDGIKFNINAPKEIEYAKDPSNNSSLIVSIINGDNSFLFMGDAENARIKEYLSIDHNTYDVLKVPHHGHYQKELRNLVGSVKPKYAVITSSNKELEDRKTMDVLENSKVYLTRTSSVEIKSNGKKLEVSYK